MLFPNQPKCAYTREPLAASLIILALFGMANDLILCRCKAEHTANAGSHINKGLPTQRDGKTLDGINAAEWVKPGLTIQLSGLTHSVIEAM